VKEEQSELTFVGKDAVVPAAGDDVSATLDSGLAGDEELADADWDAEMPTLYGDRPDK
jgi:hypothetical protein